MKSREAWCTHYHCAEERGYAMAALLVALSVMGIMLGAALPAWRTMVQREREAELVFRGEQYVQAIELFSRRTGGFPTSLNALRDGRFIRRLYKDPITDTDFQPVYLGQVPAGTPTPTGQQPQQPGRGPAFPGIQGQQQGSRGGTSPLPLTATPPQMPFTAGRGQFPASGFPQTAGPGTGPIIGVSSRSTAQSLRLYNGRNHYNEWLFVSTAATRQAGAPGVTQAPGAAAPGRGGRGGQPLAPGPGRGPGLELPGRGGPNRGFPVPPARGTPFGAPNTPQPSGPGQRGRL